MNYEVTGHELRQNPVLERGLKDNFSPLSMGGGLSAMYRSWKRWTMNLYTSFRATCRGTANVTGGVRVRPGEALVGVKHTEAYIGVLDAHQRTTLPAPISQFVSS